MASQPITCRAIAYFNSIKVQLKLLQEICNSKYGHLFQFHKGTIKTEQANTYNVDYMSFQFHKGTIKTRDKPQRLTAQIISIP